MRNAAIVFFLAAIVAGVFETRAERRVVAAAAMAMTVEPAAEAGGTATPWHEDDVVIPVAGIHREQLKPMFNDARTGHAHHALDILAPRGTPVLAAVDGTIRKLFVSGAGGLTIYETDPGEVNIFYYAHLDRYAATVHEGMAVKRGDVIGYVGTSGNAPAGTPHLHFAIMLLPPTKEWWKGDAIDPYPILMQHGKTVDLLLPQ